MDVGLRDVGEGFVCDRTFVEPLFHHFGCIGEEVGLAYGGSKKGDTRSWFAGDDLHL